MVIILTAIFGLEPIRDLSTLCHVGWVSRMTCSARATTCAW